MAPEKILLSGAWNLTTAVPWTALIGAARKGRDALVLFLDTSFHVAIVLGFFFLAFFHAFFFSKRSKIMVVFLYALAFWSFCATCSSVELFPLQVVFCAGSPLCTANQGLTCRAPSLHQLEAKGCVIQAGIGQPAGKRKCLSSHKERSVLVLGTKHSLIVSELALSVYNKLSEDLNDV